MKDAPTVVLENSLIHRANYVLSEYDPEFLKDKELPQLLSIIERNCPNINLSLLRQSVREEKWSDFVSTVIKDYYDPLYNHAISRRKKNFIGNVTVNSHVKDSIPSMIIEIFSILSKCSIKP